mgnify:CR=1 FL=1
MIKKKIAVICHNDHHIEKSLLVKQRFRSDVEIYCFKNKLLKKFKDKSSQEINIKFIASFDVFIFFTLQTDKTNIILYELIRKSQKIIVAFQESHQLGMHGGDVNNLILQADMIFAASSDEKDELESSFFYQEDQVKSYGWLFSDDKIAKKRYLVKNKKDVLLILSAPESITSSSYETLSLREDLIGSIIELNPKNKLYIKPHPLEDLSNLESIISVFTKKNHQIALVQSPQEFNNVIQNSDVIYSSNRTQSCVDMIGTRKLVIYFLGPDNFITSHIKKFNVGFKRNSINFMEFCSEESIESFQSRYINRDTKNFLNIENLILSLPRPKETKPDHNIEIILWQYIYGLLNKQSLLNYLIDNSLINLIQIFESPEKVTQNELDILSSNLSIKTSIFLIYLREIMRSEVPLNENIIEIVKKNVSRWFAQYYSLDVIHLFFYLKNKHPEVQVMEEKSTSLILNSIQILQKKSLILNLFIMLTTQITFIKNAKVRSQIFKYVNLVWGLIKK